MKKYSITHSLFLSVSLCYLAPHGAYAIDWQRLPEQKITLFYPGQSSWEWLLTKHKGAAGIKSGKFCQKCHADIQQEMGQKLISGAFLEPDPIAGKAGSIEVEIKTAYDAENLYLNLAWTAAPNAGADEYPDYEEMVSVMLDDGRVPEIARGGCWGACHADVNGMPSADSDVNISKYLVKSRSRMTRHGGGNHIKSTTELQNLLDSGFFAEIWQTRLNRGQETNISQGYILARRHDHAKSQVSAKSRFDNGRWTVELSRPLTINEPGYKNITPGKTYTLGFAVHEGHVKGRRHYVSLGYTLRLDEGPADIIARKQ